MGTWSAPLTSTPSMIKRPMAELEVENFNFANSGKKAQTIPMHRIWENRKTKILAISRLKKSCFHLMGDFPLLIYFSERVGGSKKRPINASKPIQINEASRLKRSWMTPPNNGPMLNPQNMDILNSPMENPSLPAGVISPTYAWMMGISMAEAIP